MKTMLVVLFTFFVAQFALAQTSVPDGNYFCEDEDSTGVNFNVSLVTTNAKQSVIINSWESKGGYVCEGYCNNMFVYGLPFEIPYDSEGVIQNTDIYSIAHKKYSTGPVRLHFAYIDIEPNKPLRFVFGYNIGYTSMLGTNCTMINP